MNKQTGSVWFCLAFIMLLCLSCGDGSRVPQLKLAVGANMQFAMEDLAADFKQTTGISCDMVVSSSGKLTAQIMEGAPFHILLSADMKYPEELHKKGYTAAPPEVYAYGRLVLWTLSDRLELSVGVLGSDRVRHVALANPETAPYGRAAMEVLKGSGLLGEVRDKLVFGESIAQTNQFIISRAAEIGFTSRSVVEAPQMREQGRWIDLDTTLYSPISQGIAVMNNPQPVQEDALAFREYLFSSRAREILKKYGYWVDE